MGVLEDAERLLASMTRGEKAQLLKAVVRDLGDAFPGIESIPGVSGGEDLVNAWAHARSHRDEIDRQIEENEAA